MKKIFFAVTLAAMAFTYTSCDKVAEKLFQPFEQEIEFDFTIDPVLQGLEGSLGNSVISYNLDAEVRNVTSGAFGADFIKSMTITNIAISLNNADTDNNLSNFERFTVTMVSGAGNPVVMGPFPVPANANNELSIAVTNSPNIRQFFNGNQVTFAVTGLARKSTNKSLNATVATKIKFDK